MEQALAAVLTIPEPFLRFRRCTTGHGQKLSCIASRPDWMERILRRVWRWMRPAISMARRFGGGLRGTPPGEWRSSTPRKFARLGDCNATLAHSLDEMLADSRREIVPDVNLEH